MRVLFSVSPWPTHYAAAVPLGWALQAGGHEVRVLCHPSQATPVANAGLLPVAVLDGMDVVLHNRMTYVGEALAGRWPYPWLPLHPITGAQMSTMDAFDLDAYHRDVLPELARRSSAGHDAAVAFARRFQPDVVVHDPVSTEGLLAARVLNVPAALALWGPVGTHEGAGVDILGDDLGGSFARYGCEPFGPDAIGHIIDPCPAALEPPTRAQRLPARFVPYNGGGAATVPDWVDEPADRPRVAVTWSTALSIMSGPNSYALPRIVAGLAELDIELVLTATAHDVAALGPVPPSVRVLSNCPLRLLLKHCDLVIHHGGAGSTMTALAVGVPQLAITFAPEQARVGERLAAAAVGRHLPGHLATPEAIRAEALAVLGYRAIGKVATELAAENTRRPTPVELVDALDKLTRG
jgi:UDP:flavonoid glycosyltransferase YjiC (YdhE family)